MAPNWMVVEDEEDEFMDGVDSESDESSPRLLD